MVDILSHLLRHGPVPFIGVHHRRKDILFTAYDAHGGLVGICVELLGEVIAAVVVEIGRVHIEHQLSEFLRIRFQTTGGDCTGFYHLIEHFHIVPCGRFEVDILFRSLWDYILIYITSFLPLIVGLCVAHFGGCHLCVSCAGTVNTVASCHRQNTS